MAGNLWHILYLKIGETINHFNIIPAYIYGTRAALTKELIAKSFEKTGLYPVNCSVFTSNNFASSKASSSIAYVSDTFPDDFPSSDPIEPPDSDQSSDSDSDLSDGDFVITTDDGESSNTTDNVELKDAKDPMCYAPDH